MSTDVGAVGHSGTLCVPSSTASGIQVLYAPSGMQNPAFGTGTSSYICPVPVGFSVGSTIQWSFRVFDGNSSSQISCRGYTYDSDGNLINVTTFANSGAAFIGTHHARPPERTGLGVELSLRG